MSDLQNVVDDLQARLARLERARPRGRTNQLGAARYLNISEETLRQRHARGEGPRRSRNGARGWSYTYDDLDAYAEQSAA